MLRLGVSIEYEGKDYDILEVPSEVFIQLIPGLTKEQFQHINLSFEHYWPEPTRRRNHILAFIAEQMGTSVDLLLMTRKSVQFSNADLMRYMEEQTRQGNRPS